MKAKFKLHATGTDDPNYQISVDEWNGNDVIELTENIKNVDIDTSAAIAETKLALTRSTSQLADEVDAMIAGDNARFSAGWLSGGSISLTIDQEHVNILAGTGRAFNGTHFIPVSWSNFLDVAHVYNTYNYIYIKYDGTLLISDVVVNSNQYIRLGRFWYDPTSGTITVIWNYPLQIGDYQWNVDDYIGDILGSVIHGCECTEKDAPNQLQLNFAAGSMRVRFAPKLTFAGTSTFLKIYQCSDYFVVPDMINNNSIIDTTLWADKTKTAAIALTVMTTGYWAKAYIVVNTQGLYYYVYPEAEYATEDEAKAAPLPLFDSLIADYNASICAIIYQKGDTTIADHIIDLRPDLINRILSADFTFTKATVGLSNVLNVAQEAVANKATNLTSDDDTHYPTVKAVNTGLAGITIDTLQVVLSSQVYGG